jgi:hypothetical protein
VKREYFQGLEDQRLSGILCAKHVPAVTSCGVKVLGSDRRGGDGLGDGFWDELWLVVVLELVPMDA